MRIYLASNNAHKHAEFSSLFPMHTILLPKDEGIDFFSPEDGSTFFANARQKADALYDVVHAPVLADDSGLCVDALDG
ncbi:non-canonical purine NTP pyrophosphatase, partial [Treponema pallidum]